MCSKPIIQPLAQGLLSPNSLEKERLSHAVPVVGRAAGETEVGVALADGQVARALLGVALGFAAAAGKAVLTFRETPPSGENRPKAPLELGAGPSGPLTLPPSSHGRGK